MAGAVWWRLYGDKKSPLQGGAAEGGGGCPLMAVRPIQPIRHPPASLWQARLSPFKGGLFLELHAAYPNPFNPQAVVPFSVVTAAHVRITVFDLLGREVATLAEGRYEAGLYQAVFDGSLLPSGMYLVRANATPENGGGARAFTQRLTLLK